MNAVLGKVAIVTGASSGIGRATALLFAREGAKLVVTGRRPQALATLAAEIEADGGSVSVYTGDIRDEACAKALVDLAIQTYGKLDIAFNNAGTLGELGPVPEMPLPNWQDTIETNLTSAFLGAKYQLPAMLENSGGSIIFTSSFVGHTVGVPGMAAYAASKAGLVGLTQVLAAEYGAEGIRVNAILPGGTDTPMNAAMANTPEIKSVIEGIHALKRTALPEEISQTVLHLASDTSSFMTGAALLVDGGVSISRF